MEITIVAGLVFGWDKALYALVTLYIWGIAADQVLELDDGRICRLRLPNRRLGTRFEASGWITVDL